MQLSQKFFSYLPESVKHEQTKFFFIFTDCQGRKVYFSGKRVQLLHYQKEFGDDFKEITEDQAKIKHLGKVRCLGSSTNEGSLLSLLSKYFMFAIPSRQQLESLITTKPIIEKRKKSANKKSINKLIQPLVGVPISERDEGKLILSYREATEQRVKDKIFRKILYERGVNEKNWDQIIKGYVAFNRYKFSHILDFTESDFYQEIVIALHKQVEKWFDPSKNCCFSTYAWFVINCAFHRVLQSLSTQKRKVSYLATNVDLNDQDCVWDECISSEKTLQKQMHFEDEMIYKNLFSHIQKIFELKPVKASEELKNDLLKVIQNKTTVQTSLYELAKKHDVTSDEVFKLEIVLRENLKNAMYADIISYMKDDINGDDVIAKKYKRSKGHVIKMKRQLSQIVRTKMKSIESI